MGPAEPGGFSDSKPCPVSKDRKGPLVTPKGAPVPQHPSPSGRSAPWFEMPPPPPRRVQPVTPGAAPACIDVVIKIASPGTSFFCLALFLTFWIRRFGR